MSLALMAMNYARLAHADQSKITLAAQVAGIVATIPRGFYHPLATHEEMIAAAWLHNVTESRSDLVTVFGPIVAGGILLLSEADVAPNWVQTIKVAVLISDGGGIDAALLDVLTGAHPALLAIAREMV